MVIPGKEAETGLNYISNGSSAGWEGSPVKKWEWREAGSIKRGKEEEAKKDNAYLNF